MRQLLIATSLLTLALSASAQTAQQGTKQQPVAIIQTSMGDLKTCTLSQGRAHRHREFHRSGQRHKRLDRSQNRPEKARRAALRRHDFPSRHPEFHDSRR